jgi:2-C-methyl-D-erythritol 4-phosphate cytidylyltransferase
MESAETKVVAVILAGGLGARVGTALPKQFIKVAGKTIIEHTISVFQASDSIDEIVVMTNPEWILETSILVSGAKFTKVSNVLPGGATRNETTKAALKVLDDEDVVLLHDAVRPLIDDRIIRDCLVALKSRDAVDVVIPSADTLVMVDSAGVISDIPDRASFRRGQTPQGFRVSILREAYRNADQDPNFKATDDCAVVLKYLPNTPIATVLGSDQNMKITEAIDLFLIDKLFQVSSHDAPDTQAQKSLFENRVAVIFGGSEGIGKAISNQLTALGSTVEVFSRSTNGVDVSNFESVAKALKQASTKHGHIDFVINAAGILHIGNLAEQDLKIIASTIGVNFHGAINVAKASFEYLSDTQGHLLLFTSSSYTRGRAEYSVYSSSKAAIVNLGQALSDEWSDKGIKVNVVNPERTLTPMRTKAFGAEDPDSLLSADEVSDACIRVLGSEMTGHVIDVRRKN